MTNRRINTARLPTPPELGFPFFFPLRFNGPRPPPPFGANFRPPNPNFDGEFRPQHPPDFDTTSQMPTDSNFNQDDQTKFGEGMFSSGPPPDFDGKFPTPPPNQFFPGTNGPPPHFMFGHPPTSASNHPSNLNSSGNPVENDEYFEDEEFDTDTETETSDDNKKNEKIENEDDENDEEIIDEQFDEKLFKANYVEEDAFADKLFQYLNTPTRPSPKKTIKDSQLGHLKFDPSYKWLLKDLSLSNEKRVIDVTDMLMDEEVVKEKIAKSIEEENESNRIKNIKRKPRKKLIQDNNENNKKSNKIDESFIKSDNSIDNELKDILDESSEMTSPTNTNKIPPSDVIDEDKNYINRLYEKLLSGNDKNNKKDDSNIIYEDFENIEKEVEESDSKLYDKWSKTHRNNEINKQNQDESIKMENLNEDDEESYNEKKKPNNKYSKSFELSLSDLDDMINRVDNGIKLKRNNKETSNNNSPRPSSANKNIDVESLKKEWNEMFNKLENDYKQKLEEQQKLNDQKLKSLHEDIKQSIIDQQDKLLAKQQLQKDEIPILNPNEALNDLSESIKSSTIPIISNSNINSVGSVVDNAKYISNLRLELKTKHARHIQDLKEYYEKEIDELGKKLDYYRVLSDKQINLSNKQPKSGGSSTESYDYVDDFEGGKLFENLTKTNEEYLKLNNDLNNANSKLLDKLTQANQHINYLTHENIELKKRLDNQDLETKNANIKLANLENCVAQLEIQLSDSIKLQDDYMRELHSEKRSLIKKIQECEELKLTIKYLEQKCSNFELKLDEKDTLVSRLKHKYVQLEQETNRMEYEYQRLRNNHTTLTLQNQQLHNQPLSSKSSYQMTTSTSPYNNNNNLKNSNQQKSTELPIRHEQRSSTYQSHNSVSSNNNPISTSSSSSSQTSPLNQKTSPNINNNNNQNQQQQRNKSPHLLTIVCNLDPQTQRKKSVEDLNMISNNNHSSRLSTASFAGSINQKDIANQQPRPKSMVSSKSADSKNLNELDKYKTFKEYNTFNEYLTNTQQDPIKLASNTSLNGGNNSSNISNQPPSMFPKATLLHSTTSIKYQNYRQQSPPKQWTLQQPQQVQQHNYQSPQQTQNYASLNGDKYQIKYIEKLENDFDLLMKHKQQLDAQLTRLPPKLNNTNMHIYKENIENELNIVEKKLASIKLELRKLNVIRTN